MSFDKWQWFDAIYADRRFTDAEKAVLAWVVVKAVFTNRDTFRLRQRTVSERTGVGERTIRRAYGHARDYGYLAVSTQRERGRAGKADEYRLLVPANLAATSEVPDKDGQSTGQDCTEYRTESTEVPDTAEAGTCENDTPISSLTKFSLEVRDEGTEAKSPAPLDTLPDIFPDEEIVFGELVGLVADPEPPLECDAHRDLPLTQPRLSCPDCGRVRRTNQPKWDAWNGRRLVGSADAKVEGWLRLGWKCNYCHDTRLIVLSDGTHGSAPAVCNHDGTRRLATEEELRQLREAS